MMTGLALEDATRVLGGKLGLSSAATDPDRGPAAGSNRDAARLRPEKREPTRPEEPLRLAWPLKSPWKGLVSSRRLRRRYQLQLLAGDLAGLGKKCSHQ